MEKREERVDEKITGADGKEEEQRVESMKKREQFFNNYHHIIFDIVSSLFTLFYEYDD